MQHFVKTTREKDDIIEAMNKVLRNPLHAILGNLDLLEKETKDLMKLDLIKKAKNNGEVLMNMMNNILFAHNL